MQCPKCNTPFEEDAVFCGTCGTQIQPIQASGATVVADTANEQQLGADSPTLLARSYNRPGVSSQSPPQQRIQVSPTTGRDRFIASASPDISNKNDIARSTPITPPPPSRARTRRFVFLAIILVLLVVVVTGGTLALLRKNTSTNGAVATNVSGLISFSDSTNSQGHTDALKIDVNGLSAPSAGFQYEAWLVNETAEQTLALGTLVAQGQAFSLNFSDQGTNLLGQGNKLEITSEQGNVKLPTGKILLTGTFPPEAFVHIKHLLFSFPTTPGKIGLLVGLLEQVQQLNTQTVLLKSFVNNGDKASIQCAAQSIVDIAEGAQGPHALPLTSDCTSLGISATGDGFGILGSNGYVSTTAAHASLAATQHDSTQNIKLQARHVEIATDNIKDWVTTIDQDALALLTNPANTTKVQEMVTLSNQALNGVDTNNDGQVDSVPGEAGTILAYNEGHLMASLPLVPASA